MKGWRVKYFLPVRILINGTWINFQVSQSAKTGFVEWVFTSMYSQDDGVKVPFVTIYSQDYNFFKPSSMRKWELVIVNKGSKDETRHLKLKKHAHEKI